MNKQFKAWKRNKLYFKKKQEKRERIIFIVCCATIVLGLQTGSYIFNSSPVGSGNITVEQESDNQYIPDGFLSMEAYERSFRESNRHLYE